MKVGLGFLLSNASCYPAGTLSANKSAKPTPLASSRETRPTHWLPNALAPQHPGLSTLKAEGRRQRSYLLPSALELLPFLLNFELLSVSLYLGNSAKSKGEHQ
jgi:hypothetical protein